MSLYFIYGTLKKGMKNSHVMKHVKAEFIAEVETIKPYPMFDLGNGFPYVQNVKGKGSILQGELYEINPKFDKDLDRFEGVPDLYNRGKITVEVENLKYEDVNCYFISDELDNFELQEVDMMTEWKEEAFDFEAYHKKISGN